MIILARFAFVLTLTVLGSLLGRPTAMVEYGLGALALGCVVVLGEVLLQRMATRDIIIIAAGKLLGLFAANLLLFVWYTKRDFNPLYGIIINILFAYLGGMIALSKRNELYDLIPWLTGTAIGSDASPKLLDTSVIIDGRIVDVCNSRFIEGELLIPRFVLKELQMVADSADSLRRQRGRRGLDVLKQLQDDNAVAIRIIDHDFPEIPEVDTKLIKLAKTIDAKVLTHDYNLNKVANLQDVVVLNINDLSNALKPVVLPGEKFIVQVMKEGKEYGQGVGYLEDGTMVVVDNGRAQIGKRVTVIVTSIIQTSAGRMIFTRYDEGEQA